MPSAIRLTALKSHCNVQVVDSNTMQQHYAAILCSNKAYGTGSLVVVVVAAVAVVVKQASFCPWTLSQLRQCTGPVMACFVVAVVFLAC